MNEDIAKLMGPIFKTVRPDLPVWRAFSLMKVLGVHYIPVVDQRQTVGVLTDRDLRIVSKCDGSETLPILEVMVKNPYCAFAHSDPFEVIENLKNRELDFALVTNDDGQVQGVFTVHHALEFLLKASLKKSDTLGASRLP